MKRRRRGKFSIKKSPLFTYSIGGKSIFCPKNYNVVDNPVTRNLKQRTNNINLKEFNEEPKSMKEKALRDLIAVAGI